MGLFDRFKKNAGREEPPQPQTYLVPGVGRMPYPAYRGKEPYIFISYARADKDAVYAEIKRFNEAGYHVWYDEGIAPGNEWTDEIADALADCALFVVLITPTSAPRENVQNEINFALDEKKPFLAIHLEETELKRGLKLQIGTKQAILKYKMSEEEYTFKYIDAFTRLGLKRNENVKPGGSAGVPAQPAPAPAAAPVPVAAPVEPIPVQPVPAQPAAPGAAQGQGGEVFDDSPEDARKRANGDLVRVGDYDIEHGSLKGYFGTEKDLVLPRSAAVIGSTSFKRCRLFVESIDLNRAGCILGNAFVDCPKLHTVKVPPTVTTIYPNAFHNCPNVTLYVRRSQLPEGFDDKFDGKDIVYLDEE